MLTSASNLTPQVGRFFAKGKGAKKRPTRSAVYAGVSSLTQKELLCA